MCGINVRWVSDIIFFPGGSSGGRPAPSVGMISWMRRENLAALEPQDEVLLLPPGGQHSTASKLSLDTWTQLFLHALETRMTVARLYEWGGARRRFEENPRVVQFAAEQERLVRVFTRTRAGTSGGGAVGGVQGGGQTASSRWTGEAAGAPAKNSHEFKRLFFETLWPSTVDRIVWADEQWVFQAVELVAKYGA